MCLFGERIQFARVISAYWITCGDSVTPNGEFITGTTRKVPESKHWLRHCYGYYATCEQDRAP